MRIPTTLLHVSCTPRPILPTHLLLARNNISTISSGFKLHQTQIHTQTRRNFSSQFVSQNRIYNPVRNQEDFTSILLATTGNNVPLITLWTTSYCSTCRQVTPMIKHLLEEDASSPPTTTAGPEPRLSTECKVAFVEIEMDSPDVTPVAGNYLIRTVPTLLAFRRGLPVYEKALTTKHDLTSRARLVSWIEDVAREGEHDRRNFGGEGGGFLGRLFGRH